MGRGLRSRRGTVDHGGDAGAQTILDEMTSELIHKG